MELDILPQFLDSLIPTNDELQSIAILSLAIYGMLQFFAINFKENSILQHKSNSFLVGNQEFNSPQFIPQKDIDTFSYPKQGYPNINSYYVKRNGRIFQKRVDDLKKLRKATKSSYLVNPDFREIVEMAYWFVKFVGQFGKEYKAHIAQKTEAELKPDAKDNEVKFSGAFTKNTATMISYMRFFLKFLSSFEKLFKKV